MKSKLSQTSKEDDSEIGILFSNWIVMNTRKINKFKTQNPKQYRLELVLLKKKNRKKKGIG